MSSSPTLKHIEHYGLERYSKVLAAAILVVREDSRFTGAEKIRNAIARAAALRATGYAPRQMERYSLPAGCGMPTTATDNLFEKALAAAKRVC